MIIVNHHWTSLTIAIIASIAITIQQPASSGRNEFGAAGAQQAGLKNAVWRPSSHSSSEMTRKRGASRRAPGMRFECWDPGPPVAKLKQESKFITTDSC